MGGERRARGRGTPAPKQPERTAAARGLERGLLSAQRTRPGRSYRRARGGPGRGRRRAPRSPIRSGRPGCGFQRRRPRCSGSPPGSAPGVAAGFGFAPLRRGERRKRRARRASTASGSCGDRSFSRSSEAEPATLSVERLDTGWSEAASASLRGGGRGSGGAEERGRERENRRRSRGWRLRIWDSIGRDRLLGGNGFCTKADQRFHFAVLRLVAFRINSDKL